MLDKLRQFLDDRAVTLKDFIMVSLSMGFLSAMVIFLLYGAIGALFV